MPGQFIQTASTPNDMVALPRIDTRYLGLDEILTSEQYTDRATLNQIVDDYSIQDVVGYLELNGLVQSHDRIDYSYYEGEEMTRPVSVDVITAGSTAAAGSFTLKASDYRSVGSIYGTAQRSPLMDNQMLMFATGAHAQIVAKSGDGPATLYSYVARDGSGDDILAALTYHKTNNLQFNAYTVAFSEGSASPKEGIAVPTIRYLNQMQTFRHIDKITGDADVLKKVITWQGKTRIVDEQRLRQEWRHRMDVQRAMLWSPGGTITRPGSVPGSGLTRLTMGLEASIRQVGSIYNYDDETSFDPTDWDAIKAWVNANEGATTYNGFLGWKLSSGLQSTFKTILGTAFTAIDPTNFGTMSSKRDKMVELGFNGFTEGGITINLQTSRAFSEKNVTGLPGYRYPGMGFLIPAGNQRITVGADNGVKQAMNVPSLRLLYTKSSTGQDRRMYTFERGIETTGIDQRELETFTQQGFQAVNLKKFILVQGD